MEIAEANGNYEFTFIKPIFPIIICAFVCTLTTSIIIQMKIENFAIKAVWKKKSFTYCVF